MPHGFFVVEQRKTVKLGALAEWAPIHHFDASTTLTKVMEWTVHLQKWHAESPESLERGATAYEQNGGKSPVATRSR
jgi:hypothetical protein